MVDGSVAVNLGVVVASILGLWVGARLSVDAAVRFARRVGLSQLTIGLTVVAIGTSAPELAVTTDAALAGAGDVAVGNVIGSNVYNLAVVLGVVSLVRVIPVERSLVHRDGAVLVASTLIGVAAIADMRVGRLEGVVLVALLVVYTGYLLLTGADPDAATDGANPDPSATGPTGDSPDAGLTTAVGDRIAFRGRDAVFLLGGVGLVLASGDALVGAATTLARGAGISEWVIGGTIVAAGTSTPEFAVSLVAMRRGTIGVSVGNVVGSNVFNVLGVLGVGAIVRPLTVTGPALTTAAWLTVVVVATVAAMWSGRVLSRVEGGLLALSEAARWTLGLLGLTA